MAPRRSRQGHEGVGPVGDHRQGLARLVALAGQQDRPARFTDGIDLRVGDKAKALARAVGALAATDGELKMARAA